MAWFYNFNFNEDVMYCMPIAVMSDVYYGKRKVRINKGEELKKTCLMRYCPFCGRRLRR